MRRTSHEAVTKENLGQILELTAARMLVSASNRKGVRHQPAESC